MSGFVLDQSALVILGVVALCAFATQGATGFGGTVLATTIGAQLLPLEVLLPAFVPVNMLMSAWILVRGFSAIHWRLLVRDVAPALGAGASVGLALFHLPGKGVLALMFGVFVTALATLQLVRPTDAPLGGVARTVLLAGGGVVHGLFGTGGPLIVYVVRRQLVDKQAFRASLAVVWLVLNTALLANFASAQLYSRAVGEVGLVLALTIIPGLLLGERIHRRLDAAGFERFVWLVLLLAGVALAARSAWTLV